jgi:uncharacterized RDD family membrane protein YckC
VEEKAAAERIGFGRRLGAYLLDIIVALIGGGVIGMFAGAMYIILVIMLLEAFTGQTIGKMMLGIKNGDEDGATASSGKLITRAAVKYIGTILALIAGLTGVVMVSTIGSLLGFAVFIGYFFILGDKKQGFHDMIAKTAVFNKSDLA